MAVEFQAFFVNIKVNCKKTCKTKTGIMEMSFIDLTGKWKLRQVGQEETIPANVPGDNYSALLQAGKISDPYYGMNELDVQWVREFDWEYSREFEVSAEMLACESVYLNAEILDTFANIHINGKKVASTRNMFKRHRLEIKKYLKSGINTIEIIFLCPGREALKEKNKFPYELPDPAGNTVSHMNHIRKVQCHAGWDWGITLLVSGIYGDISIHGVDKVRIEHVYTEQKHSKKQCVVTAVAELNAVVSGKVAVDFNFNGENVTVKSSVKPGVNFVRAEFLVKNPALWWPAGSGKQPLYELTVAAGSETVSRKIGLRTIEVVNEPDEIGACMKFRVNGVDIFCKGANWIPADAMPERHTREVYYDLISSAVEAHMNMIRVWGGGQYEQEAFYEICDELGVMIWHDMMFSCSLYPGIDNFIDNVKEELEYQLKRLRSHACIAIWCGDNECIGAVGWNSGDDTSKRDRNLVNYDRLNRELERAVEKYAPEFTFWPSSPCGGPGNFEDGWHNDSCGDMHYWEVWHGSKPIEAYFDVTPRFCSEFGFQSFPSREVFDSFAQSKDANVFAPVMEHHQKCPKGNGNIIAMFEKYFRMPEGFDNYLYLSQVTQALAIKTGVEHWRHLMPVCMGTIYWQLNDNWPVASWASIEYGGKWKQLHYNAKRFFAPVISSTFQKDGALEIWSVSDLMASAQFKVEAVIYDFSGKQLDSYHFDSRIAARTSKKLKTLKLDKLDFKLNEAFMVITTTADGKDGVYTHTNTHFFDRYKRCELPMAKVTAKVRESDGEFEVVLSTDEPAFFVNIDVYGIKGTFSDNSITLLPGETVLKFNPKEQVTADTLQKSLTVKHLRETY